MKRRRVYSLLLASSIALTLLTGCTTTKETELPQLTEEQQEKPETKTYDPYEHFFFKRYKTIDGEGLKRNAEEVTGGSLERPDGYEIYDIDPWVKTNYKSSETGGYDVWYINYMPVEVEPVWNESINNYDYAHAGKVIEMQEELENDPYSFSR